MEHKIYLSGPLFSQGEIDWGRHVKLFLEERLSMAVVWPHEFAAGSTEEIFQANLFALAGCDLMVAMLDGPQVDDGTAWEVGYFYSQGKRIYGIRTDFRRAGESDGSKVNLMVERSCRQVAGSLEELAQILERLPD
jgi:nucleoside 2-deoxyribosyltransferase